DKATTLRILNAFSRHGFVEQDSETKRYRLGTSVLHLARVREASAPITAIAQPIVDSLALKLNETAHACLGCYGAMLTISVGDPQRSARVIIDPAQLLPLHATATGLAYLAFAKPDVVATALGSKLSRHTATTTSSLAKLRQLLESIRESG